MHRKCPIEEMLEGEIADNLGYDKCQLSENNYSGNGHSS